MGGCPIKHKPAVKTVEQRFVGAVRSEFLHSRAWTDHHTRPIVMASEDEKKEVPDSNCEQLVDEGLRGGTDRFERWN